MQKLVRDRIPEIIRRNGARPITRRLTHDELLPALFQKLDEEVAELRAAGTLEEMADVLEVLIALAAYQEFSEAELLQVLHTKRQERGGFTQGIWLEEVE